VADVDSEVSVIAVVSDVAEVSVITEDSVAVEAADSKTFVVLAVSGEPEADGFILQAISVEDKRTLISREANLVDFCIYRTS
jgi:hypothetical protein